MNVEGERDEEVRMLNGLASDVREGGQMSGRSGGCEQLRAERLHGRKGKCDAACLRLLRWAGSEVASSVITPVKDAKYRGEGGNVKGEWEVRKCRSGEVGCL